MLARREFSRSELKGRLQKALRDDARKVAQMSAECAPNRKQDSGFAGLRARRESRLVAGDNAAGSERASESPYEIASVTSGVGADRRLGAVPGSPTDPTNAGRKGLGCGAGHTPAVHSTDLGTDQNAAPSATFGAPVPEEALGAYEDSMIIGEVLDALEAVGSLSDERFVSSFVSSRVRRGKGPVLIRAELRDRGVDEELVDRFLTFSDAYWVDRARMARNKRFGTAPAVDAVERNRQARFLAGRGFASDLIRRVVMDR